MTVPHFRDYVKGLSGIATAFGVDPDDADGVAAALTDLADAITTLNGEVAAIEADLAAGGVILYGTAAPTTEGVDGDFYIRLVGGVPTTIYGPKASGTWPSGSGLQGATGATGSAGTNGTDGKTIRYGTAAPTTEGVDGDFYIRLVGSVPTTIYGPKASGSWPSGSGLQGATGATGAAGADATAIYGDPVTIAHGGTGQTTAAAGLTALGGIAASLVDAKGDSIVGTADNTVAREAVGANGTFLVANSAQSTGRNWRTVARGDLPVLPTCTVSDSAVSVPDTTTTIIATGATESADTDGFHSDVTNRSRMTIPSGLDGWYLVSARASWASNATGYRRLNILVGGVTRYTLYVIPAASGSAMNFAFTLMVQLAAADFLQVEAQQTSGAGLNVTLSEWTIVRLGNA